MQIVDISFFKDQITYIPLSVNDPSGSVTPTTKQNLVIYVKIRA
jgi:hypothetical protein